MKAGDLVRIREEEEIMLVVDMNEFLSLMALCLRGGHLQYIPKDMLETIG